MVKHTIQSVSLEQLPQCLETIHKAFSINCEKYGFTEENYPSCAAFIGLEDLIKAKENGTHFYAVFIDGRVAGCVQLKRIDAVTYSFTRFAVLPEYQHLGLGRELVAHCKAKATEYGAKKMTLLMVYENESLRRFYESCGFTLVETKRDSQHPFLCGIYEMIL